MTGTLWSYRKHARTYTRPAHTLSVPEAAALADFSPETLTDRIHTASFNVTHHIADEWDKLLSGAVCMYKKRIYLNKAAYLVWAAEYIQRERVKIARALGAHFSTGSVVVEVTSAAEAVAVYHDYKDNNGRCKLGVLTT